MLEELKEKARNSILLVEGQKDRIALSALDVKGEVWQVKGGDSIFQIAENLAKERKRAVILTDWDRKGGQLCRLLKNALKANGVEYDDTLRMKLVKIAKSEVKDVQGLPSLYSRLVAETQRKIDQQSWSRKRY
ncbi:MAG: hypothetical protein FJ151_01430 [Euryarchaeota archaeon]|nr:hypothetical protein [Euryarchaeota archaeon]